MSVAAALTKRRGGNWWYAPVAEVPIAGNTYGAVCVPWGQTELAYIGDGKNRHVYRVNVGQKTLDTPFYITTSNRVLNIYHDGTYIYSTGGVYYDGYQLQDTGASIQYVQNWGDSFGYVVNGGAITATDAYGWSIPGTAAGLVTVTDGVAINHGPEESISIGGGGFSKNVGWVHAGATQYMRVFTMPYTLLAEIPHQFRYASNTIRCDALSDTCWATQYYGGIYRRSRLTYANGVITNNILSIGGSAYPLAVFPSGIVYADGAIRDPDGSDEILGNLSGYDGTILQGDRIGLDGLIIVTTVASYLYRVTS